MSSALDIFLVMRYVRFTFTYLHITTFALITYNSLDLLLQTFMSFTNPFLHDYLETVLKYM